MTCAAKFLGLKLIGVILPAAIKILTRIPHASVVLRISLFAIIVRALALCTAATNATHLLRVELFIVIHAAPAGPHIKVSTVDLDAARPALRIYTVGTIVRVDTGIGAGFWLVYSGAHAAHLGGDEIVSVECTALMLVG